MKRLHMVSGLIRHHRDILEVSTGMYLAYGREQAKAEHFVEMMRLFPGGSLIGELAVERMSDECVCEAYDYIVGIRK